MKKTYWWRVLVLAISFGGVFCGLAYNKYLCFSEEYKECLFDQYRLTVIKPALIFLVALAIISLFLVFVTDFVFKKWLMLGMVWTLITIILVSLMPVYSGGWIGLNPTKSLVSIWMAKAFVIVSLVLIIWQSIKERKK
jgi:hypothetical protein